MNTHRKWRVLEWIDDVEWVDYLEWSVDRNPLLRRGGSDKELPEHIVYRFHHLVQSAKILVAHRHAGVVFKIIQ